MIKAEVVDKQGLTPREVDILGLLCEGKVDKVIARELAISIKTLEGHLGRLYAKMQVREASINARCATIALAVSRGMVRLTNTTLAAVLMVSAVSLDDHAIHRARVRSHRSGHVRVVNRES